MSHQLRTIATAVKLVRATQFHFIEREEPQRPTWNQEQSPWGASNTETRRILTYRWDYPSGTSVLLTPRSEALYDKDSDEYSVSVRPQGQEVVVLQKEKRIYLPPSNVQYYTVTYSGSSRTNPRGLSSLLFSFLEGSVAV